MSAKTCWDWSLGGLILLMIGCWPASSSAQITVGYRNPIGVSVSRTLFERKAKKETRLFELAGVNVIPIERPIGVPDDGYFYYTEDSTFQILDQNKPFSLNVVDGNEIKTFENKTSAESVSAGRTEDVFVFVGNAAARTIPQPIGELSRSNAFLDPTPNLSVFSP